VPAPASLAITPLDDIGTWARSNLLIVVLVVIGAVLLTRLATWLGDLIAQRVERSSTQTDALVRSEAVKHQRAVIQVVTWALLVFVYCLAAVLVVEQLGLPLSGFVAPATVVGVALGFGAQRLVQDLLAGFFVVTERQYGFGDVIRVALPGIPVVVGTVEEVTLRITRIRSVDGEVIITPNGQIMQVTNLSRDWARAVIDVPVPVSVDVIRVSDVLRSVCEAAFEDEELHPLLLDVPSVMGVESLEVDQFNVRVVARTLPGKQFEVGRAMRVRITAALLREGISVAATVAADDPDGQDRT